MEKLSVGAMVSYEPPSPVFLELLVGRVGEVRILTSPGILTYLKLRA